MIAEYKGYQYVRMRGPNDIWENLYEFILIEEEGPLEIDKLFLSRKIKTLLGSVKTDVISVSEVYKQQLTHQTIYGQFILLKLHKPADLPGYKMLSKNETGHLPFPKFINQYLQDKIVSLNLF